MWDFKLSWLVPGKSFIFLFEMGFPSLLLHHDSLFPSCSISTCSSTSTHVYISYIYLCSYQLFFFFFILKNTFWSAAAKQASSTTVDSFSSVCFSSTFILSQDFTRKKEIQLYPSFFFLQTFFYRWEVKQDSDKSPLPARSEATCSSPSCHSSNSCINSNRISSCSAAAWTPTCWSASSSWSSSSPSRWRKPSLSGEAKRVSKQPQNIVIADFRFP